MKSAQVRRILRDNGFVYDHINGSHHIMKKGNLTVSVPIHKKNPNIAVGTLKSIEKQSGINIRNNLK